MKISYLCDNRILIFDLNLTRTFKIKKLINKFFVLNFMHYIIIFFISWINKHWRGSNVLLRKGTTRQLYIQNNIIHTFVYIIKYIGSVLSKAFRDFPLWCCLFWLFVHFDLLVYVDPSDLYCNYQVDVIWNSHWTDPKVNNIFA